MKKMIGAQSAVFENGAYITSGASVVGTKEGQGPLGRLFDLIGEDDLFGEECWEAAESNMQTEALRIAMEKAKLTTEKMRYLLGGDLLGQLIATSFGTKQMEIPLFGLYGACSTCGEALSLGAMLVDGGYAEHVVAVTSSHFAGAEKQFRFPLAYGNQRPLSATWTVTASGAFVLSNIWNEVAITGITTGKIVDYGVKDSMNMGACMAPAAADTIFCNLNDFACRPEAYDKIITGDLGYVGQTILLELLNEKGIDISRQHMDCGIEIFDKENQDTHSGGSGCGCSAAVLASMILPKLRSGEWKKILFVPTGALHSTVSFNEGKSVPGIAHGVVLEYCERRK